MKRFALAVLAAAAMILIACGSGLPSNAGGIAASSPGETGGFSFAASLGAIFDPAARVAEAAPALASAVAAARTAADADRVLAARAPGAVSLRRRR